MTQISKWLSLCLIAMLAFTVSSFAQEDRTDDEPVVVYDPDDVDGVRGFSKSKLVLGVNGSFPTWNQDVFFTEFLPFAGYRITDKWIAGMGINIKPLYVNYRYANGVDRLRANFLGGRIMTRYLMFHISDPAGIYAQAEFQRNRVKTKINGEVSEDYKVDPQSSALLGLGYTSNYYSGFGYTAEVFYDLLHEPNLIPEPVGELFSPWPFSFRLGFTYGF